MTGPQGWPEAASAFLRAHLPWDADEGVWDHAFISAYQMGIEALAALGQAAATDWGAVPVPDPHLPEVLPRWDDVAVAVLGLAGQQKLLTYRRWDGSPLPPRKDHFVIVPLDALPPQTPNIAAAHGLGPALADPPMSATARALGIPPPPEPPALPTLEALGLVADGAWTSAAELILWRKGIPEWDLAIADDPRFRAALDLTLATLPISIRDEIDRITTITEADISASLARHAANAEEMRLRFGPKARPSAIPDVSRIRRSIAAGRRNDLNQLFYRRWRFPEGWLSDAQAIRALAIFHDPLAQSMRRAVIARLRPDRPTFAER
ncbi:MAG: hypothetical protein AAF390_07490 [Pseudomonadota bacterium]